MKQVIGMDVGKDEVVVYGFNNYFLVKNDKKSITVFLKEHRQALKKIDLIVFEATGGYEQCLRDCLIAKQLPYHIAHPNHVRDYAKSEGYLAKTDKIDAKVIAEYAAKSNKVHAEKPLPSKNVQHLRRLLDRREQLIMDSTRESNRAQQVRETALKRSIKRHMAWLKQEITLIESDIAALEKEDDKLHSDIELLNSIPGIGKITSRVIVGYLPELRDCNEKSIAALVGVAPFNKDSGRKQGKRKIKGGRSAIRRSLYMAAMTASRTNAVVKPLFDRLIKKGKLYKVAIVAVMRKLIIIIRSVLKRQSKWVEASL